MCKPFTTVVTGYGSPKIVGLELKDQPSRLESDQRNKLKFHLKTITDKRDLKVLVIKVVAPSKLSARI